MTTIPTKTILRLQLPTDPRWVNIAEKNIEEELSEADFLIYLKDKMQLPGVKYTPVGGKKIKKVAICGGSGSFLIKDALREGADVFITGDVKYHEFF